MFIMILLFVRWYASTQNIMSTKGPNLLEFRQLNIILYLLLRVMYFVRTGDYEGKRHVTEVKSEEVNGVWKESSNSLEEREGMHPRSRRASVTKDREKSTVWVRTGWRLKVPEVVTQYTRREWINDDSGIGCRLGKPWMSFKELEFTQWDQTLNIKQLTLSVPWDIFGRRE